eukprot:jgi/Tetstr1/426798/TSEL_017013.t1
MVSLNRRLYDRIVAHQGREYYAGLISTPGIQPGASLDTLVLEPLPIRLNHRTLWEVSTVWPEFAVLDNPDLPDLLVDLSLMHALQIMLRPSRMGVDYPICLGAAAHGERAVHAFGLGGAKGHDITQQTAELALNHMGHVDVVTMEPPCQDLSPLGMQLGVQGARTGTVVPLLVALNDLQHLVAKRRGYVPD